MTWRLGIVAGEPSGDLIAARVLTGLKHADPSVLTEGIGGPQLAAQGVKIWHPMHALTVFGYVDALKRLPTLVLTYNDLKRKWLADRPQIFLGVDAPDFNLRLEHRLKSVGIPTIHFVGPSIWAWRYERIHFIKQAVSHMLVLFPFEEAIYRKEKIPVTYVGHPLADAIAIESNQSAARERLGLEINSRVLAILPGSRSSEIKLMAPRFLQAAQILVRRDPKLLCIVPMVNAQREAEFNQFLKLYPVPNLRCVIATADQAAGRPIAWDVLEACDVSLVTSGTATLEAALFKCPMVISYVLSPLMRKIMSWKSGQQRPYLPWVGLPNVLSNDFVVPELLQDDATPEQLALEIWDLFVNEHRSEKIKRRFTDLHFTLQCDTPTRAANAILQVLDAHR
jgi:lipid-A-disaccharide synthase